MSPKGKGRKCPSKIIWAPSTVKGPEIWPADSLAAILFDITSGKRVTEGRFLGINVETRGGRLPMGEP